MASEPEVEQAHLDRTHAAYYALLDAVTGLAFDAGVVVEPAAILAERPNGGRGGLYTALTRSTRALAIVHSEPLPPELAASPDLRQRHV